MAKEIKALKCPHCGSTAKTEIKDGMYRCNSCQTEYYLDDDAVNIIYHHNYTTGAATPPKADPVKAKITLVAIVVAIIVLGLLATLVFTNKVSNYTPPEPTSAQESGVKEEEYSTTRTRAYYHLFIHPGKGNPILEVIENRTYNAKSDSSKTGHYLTFYEMPSIKRVKEEKIDEENQYRMSSIKNKRFSDGNIYLIKKDNTLHRIDKSELKLNEIGKQLFSTHQELQIGIASLDFSSNDGDAINILANDGKEWVYYPIINKLYTKKSIYKLSQGFNQLLPGWKIDTYYTFTSLSSTYPDAKQQLLKVKYKDNYGGPKRMVISPSWHDNYGGSGVFYSTDPHNKELIEDYAMDDGRILNYKDLTPGRLYFSPGVLIGNSSTLLITFQASADKKSAYKVQQLNTSNGSVVWTSSLPEGCEVDEIMKTETGFMAISENDELIQMDQKGNIKNNKLIKLWD